MSIGLTREEYEAEHAEKDAVIDELKKELAGLRWGYACKDDHLKRARERIAELEREQEKALDRPV